MDFKTAAQALQDDLIKMRRDFHMEPEISFEEVKTSGKIRKRLQELGVEILPIQSGYSIVAIIRGAKPGKTIALRADMDALPMPELTDVPYKSKVEGVMHACGHDSHTAMLLGTAEILMQVKDEMCGNVKLFFQAAEEKLPGGAKALVEAGCLENPKVDALFAYHVDTSLECGKVVFGCGARQASSDSFTVIITGKGGHGAYPHRTIDPIAIAGNFITTVQNIVSRSVDPTQSAVITVGTINGGSKENIIADQVVMTGTIRSLDKNVRALLHERLTEICKGLEIEFRCNVEYIPEMGYPVLYNNTDFVLNNASLSVAKLLGSENVLTNGKASMGAEDCAYYLEQVKGCMADLGAANAAKGLTVGAHNSLFNIDEDCLWRGTATLAQVAFDFLNQ